MEFGPSELEEVPEIEEDELAVTTEELLTFEAELCETLEDVGTVAELEATEAGATEELLFCSEELDAGTSFLATPETAKSGA